jgi:hypothetical protein
MESIAGKKQVIIGLFATRRKDSECLEVKRVSRQSIRQYSNGLPVSLSAVETLA